MPLRLEHVAGPEGIAGDRILDRRDQDPQPDFELGSHDHAGEAKHIGGAAHVLLHQQHAGRRLDVEAAGVEADALADQRHFRRVLRAPSHVDQPRRAGGCAADRMDHREILLEKIVAPGHGHFGLVHRGQGPRGILQFVRPHVAGRRVDQVARQEDTIGDAANTSSIDTGRQREAQRLARLLAVAGEDIAAERHCDGRKFRLGRSGRKVPVAFRQGPRQRTDGERALAVAGAEQRSGERAVLAGDEASCPLRRKSRWP